MLLNFKIENWMSFRDEARMSMIASDAPRLDRKLPYSKAYDMKVLPICAIYGGNSAGKTNLFKAFDFLKNYITNGSMRNHMIPVDQFLLDKKAKNGVTRFCITILANESVYDYSFEVTREQVLTEKLEIEENGKLSLIYKRDCAEEDDKISFSKKYNMPEMKYASKFVGKSNLVLSNQFLRQTKGLIDVYNWFNQSLFLLSPKAKFNFANTTHKSYEEFFQAIEDLLMQIGSNIESVDSKTVDFEKINMTNEEKSNIVNFLHSNQKQNPFVTSGEDFMFFDKKTNSIVAKKTYTSHVGKDGDIVEFDYEIESDGIKKFIKMTPLLLELTANESNAIVFIDELNSSLHTNLVTTIANFFLSSTSKKSRSQLLFTTHDVDLIDEKILRQDEIVLVEQNSLGISSIHSAVNYTPALTDPHLKESYKIGRMGGIPDIYLT